jgi:hypothetical protein
MRIQDFYGRSQAIMIQSRKVQICENPVVCHVVAGTHGLG